MSPESVTGIGKKVAQNYGKAEFGRIKDHLDESTEGFKLEAAEKIEALAEQIRDLGQRLETDQEAGKIARHLEKTADYVRFRKTTDIGTDAVSAIRESRAFWIAAGLLVGILIYRSTRNKEEKTD
jgi:hypothetical protein